MLSPRKGPIRSVWVTSWRPVGVIDQAGPRQTPFMKASRAIASRPAAIRGGGSGGICAAAGTARSKVKPIMNENRIVPPSYFGKQSTLRRFRSQSAVEDGRDRRADLIDRGHAVDPADDALSLVMRQDRRGLGAIFGHPRAHRRFIVVGAALELAVTAAGTDPPHRRQLVAVVIGRVADRGGEAAGNPVDQRVLVHAQLDHMIEPEPLL